MEEKKKPLNRYERKPLVVHAIQWTGRNFEEVQLMVNEQGYLLREELYINKGMGETLRVLPGDFILKTDTNHIFILEPDVFHEDYVLGKEL